MRIRTDDEVYRVDAVWLGPPKATFPWRARYVAWLIGIPTFFVVLGIERWAGWSFGFFSTAWAFVATIVVTRLLTAKISHERPLGAVVAMAGRELNTPRELTTGTGGAVSASRVRVRAERPLPKHRRRRQYQHHGGQPGAAPPMPPSSGARRATAPVHQGAPRARRGRGNAARAGR
ncbi:hypothetical protein [Amycolatopsis sp. SID8362]|uniref:hypothetical protein n=1 Tax=Amycolatopsis sp. SID8362 TaxID=2690346 RepID=UPI001371581E|nr:hypothetical protein [Amycolatopsis sp. SID8362]NBH07586.1 hypothetical protein [Amycolatopsis sp. SID8362]NED44282.1 hypothetical protein [Amycolatopsis sp. SID8362]